MAMDLNVNVSSDHLQSMSKASPLAAILELIWNAVDADATEVDVSVQQNDLGGVDAVTVRDNGVGMSFEDARDAFGSLGGSWKKMARASAKRRRALHGKEGKGRFKVFSLGLSACWRTVHEHNGACKLVTISSWPGAINRYSVTEPVPVKESTGTTVTITTIEEGLSELLDEDVPDRLAEHLAPYLLKYPDAIVRYRGGRVDPKAAILADHTIQLSEAEDLEGAREVPSLRIIEWKRVAKRELHLCDPEGFSLEVTAPKIHAAGYNFTAYLSAKRIRQLHDQNVLSLWELNKLIDDLVDEARHRIKQHYRETKARQARTFIDQLKAENLYPFKGNPNGPMETVTRQMFDAVAVSMVDVNPRFEDSDAMSKSLSLRLVAHAIQENPRSLQKILTEVLGLSREKQDELADILEQTTLDHIISASKIVTDRLKFLDGLYQLVHAADLKAVLKERSHLHRIIEGETWIFGEEYNLTASDKSLNDVLRQHRAILGDPILIDEPVRRADGSEGIIDLMLSRTLKMPNPKQHEHLIIELKRPSVKITDTAFKQTRSYAKAIASDARFKNTNTKWTFIAVSTDLDEDVDAQARQPNRPLGQLFEDPDGRYTIWAKRWSEIIDDGRARLAFFKEKFAIELAEDAGLEHMKRAYNKVLPDEVTGTEQGAAKVPAARPAVRRRSRGK